MQNSNLEQTICQHTKSLCICVAKTVLTLEEWKSDFGLSSCGTVTDMNGRWNEDVLLSVFVWSQTKASLEGANLRRDQSIEWEAPSVREAPKFESSWSGGEAAPSAPFRRPVTLCVRCAGVQDTFFSCSV